MSKKILGMAVIALLIVTMDIFIHARRTPQQATLQVIRS